MEGGNYSLSNVIDQKVVEMSFDNSNFESNVSKSMNTLDKLKTSLNLSGATKGLENVGDATRKINFHPLASAVETVHAKFSALEVMAVTALANITNSAVNAGKRIANALTLQPIRTGFQEYETQINAVQTILANTEDEGATIKDVTKALDELNEYADLTIYNFTEMTRNIGTFTSAGVDLKTAVTAIKGISNLAAVSGANSTQAANAMYQLSQALASGTVRLQDWISVERAGMGGESFKKQLTETARAHGIAIDDMIKKYGSFRYTLQDNWLTSELLTETLSKYTMTTEGLTKEEIKRNTEMLKGLGYTDKQIKEIYKLGETATNAATKVKTFTQLFSVLAESAQSGWAKSWQLIIGDFEEAKGLLTSLSDRFTKILEANANARNAVLTEWAKEGGRDSLIKALNTLLTAIGKIVKPIKEAFRDIFPPMTGKRLAEITENLFQFTRRLRISDETADKLRRTFRGLFAILDIFKQAFGAAFNMLGNFAKGAKGLIDVILDLAAGFGDWLVSVDKFLDEYDIFPKMFGGITEAVKILLNGLKYLVTLVNDVISVIPGLNILSKAFGGVKTAVGRITDSAANMGSSLSGAMTKIKEGLQRSGVLDLLEKLLEVITSIAKALSGAVLSALKKILDDLSRGDFTAIFQFLTQIATLKVWEHISNWTAGLQQFSSMGKSVIGVLNQLRKCLAAYAQEIRAKALLAIAIAVGILAASLFLLGGLDHKSLLMAVSVISLLFMMLSKTFKSLQNSLGTSKGKMKNKIMGMLDILSVSMALIAMATSVYILASALKKIADIPLGDIMKGLFAITVLFGEVVLATYVLGKSKKTVIKGAATLIAMAIAVRIMVKAVEKLGGLEWDSLVKGIVGVTALIGGLVIAAKVLSAGKKHLKLKEVGALLLFTAAIKILVNSCVALAQFTWEQLAASVGAIVVLIGSLIGAAKALSYGKKHLRLRDMVALMMFVSAIKTLTDEVQELAMLSWKQLLKGVASVVVLIGALVGASKLLAMGKSIDMGNQFGIMKIAEATVLVAESCMKLAKFTWSQLLKGVGSVVLLMGALIGAAKLMSLGKPFKFRDMLGIIAVAQAVKMVAESCSELGRLSWGGLAKGVLGIAAITSILTGFIAMTKLIKPEKILRTSAAMVVIAFALNILAGAVIGLGQQSFGTLAKGVGALAVSLGVLTLALIALSNFNVLKGALAITIASVALGLLAGVLIIMTGIPLLTIAASLGVLALGLASFIVVGRFLSETVIARLFGFGKALVLIGIGMAAAGGGVFLLGAGVLELTMAMVECNKQGPIMTKTIVEMVAAIIKEFVNMIPTIIKKIGQGLVELIKVFGKAIPEILKVLKDLLVGLIEIIGEVLPDLIVALVDLITVALEQLGEHIPEWVDILVVMLIEVIETLAKRIPELVDATIKLVFAFFTGIVDSMKGIGAEEIGKALEGAGILAIILTVLGGLSLLAPAAMAGLLETAAVISVMTGLIMLAGGIKQIPGIEWLISEGGELLKGIGNAIGKFIGGILAGITDAASEALPKLGENLAKFMEYMGPFVKGATEIKPESLDGVERLAQIIGMITDNALRDKMLQWAGSTASMEKFASDITLLGQGLKSFAGEVEDFASEDVDAATRAVEALGILAGGLPRDGGVIDIFAGSNDLDKFAEKLPNLGQYLKRFAKQVEGMNTKDAEAAAAAAGTIAAFARDIPNEGGMISWIVGENKLDEFGSYLPGFGQNLSDFAKNVKGLSKKDVDKAAAAAEVVIAFAKEVPNEGGLLSWIVGENQLDTFGKRLAVFGVCLKLFEENTKGLKRKVIDNAAACADVVIAFAKEVPNEGGLLGWIVGENNLDQFGLRLVFFGYSLKLFSIVTKDLDKDVVDKAAAAAEVCIAFAARVPPQGGLLGWVIGEGHLDKFGAQLAPFGGYLKDFGDSVFSVNPGHIAAVGVATAELLKAFAYVPPTGGLIEIGTGRWDLEWIGAEIASFGGKLYDFNNNISKIPDLDALLHNTGVVIGIIRSFDGLEINTDTFSNLDSYLESLKKIPEGVMQFGLKAMLSNQFLNVEMVEQFKKVVDKLNEVISYVEGVDTSKVEKYTKAMQDLASLGTTNFSDQIVASEEEIKAAAKNVIDTFIAGLDANNDTLTNRMKQLATDSVDALNDTENYDYKSAGKAVIDRFASGMDATSSSITTNLSELIGASMGDMETQYENMANAGTTMATSLANGIADNAYLASDNIGIMMNACTTVIAGYTVVFSILGLKLINALAAPLNSTAPAKQIGSTLSVCYDVASAYYWSFKRAGSDVVSGLNAGISENTWRAEAQAAAMAEAALKAARKALREKSPSRAFYEIGEYGVLGFVNALQDGIGITEQSSDRLANSAVRGLTNAVATISRTVENEMDTEPTIRPVLDLSNVTDGVNSMNHLLDVNPSVDVMGRINSISSGVTEIQNGANSDVISAIKELGKSMSGGQSNTYNINGITYDDGSNVTSAIETLIRAVAMERRV